MFNVQTRGKSINWLQYLEPVVIRSQSRDETNTTRNTWLQNKTISFNWKEAIWSLKKKKENKETIIRKKS